MTLSNTDYTRKHAHHFNGHFPYTWVVRLLPGFSVLQDWTKLSISPWPTFQHSLLVQSSGGIFCDCFIARLQLCTCERVLKISKKVKADIAVMGTPSQSYGMSLAIWDHTVLPASRHKWTRPA